MEDPSLSGSASDAMDTKESPEGADAPGTPADEDTEGVDLKKMADDYAKYLIVNSKQDVSIVLHLLRLISGLVLNRDLGAFHWDVKHPVLY